MRIPALVGDLVLDRTLLGGLFGGFVVYLFEAELGLAHLPVAVRALTYGCGTATFALLKGLAARKFRSHGVPSLDPRVTYTERHSQ